MGKLVDWSFDAKQNHPCSSCGMQKKDGCCKEEAKQFKIADQNPSANFIFKALECEHLTEIDYDPQQTLTLLNGIYHQPFNNGPPAHGIAIYKYLRVFRI